LTRFPKKKYIHLIMKRRTYPNLRAYLDDTGETQERLAKRLGISQPTMSKIINGKRVPRLELALRMSRAAGVPLESLVCAYDRTETGNTCVR
jgi:transcriptional regulator with XRE-family HTH domain